MNTERHGNIVLASYNILSHVHMDSRQQLTSVRAYKNELCSSLRLQRFCNTSWCHDFTSIKATNLYDGIWHTIQNDNPIVVSHNVHNAWAVLYRYVGTLGEKVVSFQRERTVGLRFWKFKFSFNDIAKLDRTNLNKIKFYVCSKLTKYKISMKPQEAAT